MTNNVRFIGDELLRVGDVEFTIAFRLAEVPSDRLAVMKDRAMVELYLELSQTLRPRIIVELGIHRGGSTALLSELNQPEKLVAVDLRGEPAPALTDYIEHQGLGDVVRPYYGVDQSDRARLVEILDEEIGAEAIDLVIDDASHLYAETVASFETVFPRLRPGGLFVVEDWNAGHLTGDAIEHAVRNASDAQRVQIERQLEAARNERLKADPDADMRAPLTKLAVEVLVARASSGDVIRDVTVNANWLIVRRGEDVVDRDAFRLADLVHDHFGFTAAAQ